MVGVPGQLVEGLRLLVSKVVEAWKLVGEIGVLGDSEGLLREEAAGHRGVWLVCGCLVGAQNLLVHDLHLSSLVTCRRAHIVHFLIIHKWHPSWVETVLLIHDVLLLPPLLLYLLNIKSNLLGKQISQLIAYAMLQSELLGKPVRSVSVLD